MAAIRTRRWLLGLAISVTLWQVGCAERRAPAPETRSELRGDQAPLGGLGYVIGTYLTIEGVRAEGFKTGARTLSVDTVNGRKLDFPIGIWVDNVESLPESTRCVLKGYESARWIGTPPEVIEATGQISQAVWQLQRYFIATSVVQPEAAIRLRWTPGAVE